VSIGSAVRYCSNTAAEHDYERMIGSMPTVRVEPAGLDIEVAPGESVAEAAWRQGYTWPTKCWGQAECMVCYVRVVDGELDCVPADDEELFQMRTLLPIRLRSPLTRLACRIKVKGNGLVLEKKGVRPPEIQEEPTGTDS
jgi:ferredoxin, 2Fe-2S